MQVLKILLPVLMIIPCFCFAQNNGNADVESIAKSLINNIRQKDKESVFIQTDKKLYQQGETIWFKAFIVDSLNNHITYKNKIVYVDLINDKDSVMNVLLLHGDGASINGSIVLNDSSMHGYYWLRAYTQKIIDNNINNIGLQAVYVVNNKFRKSLENNQEVDNAITGDTQPVVEIYPEGGWLISGANSVVALKVHDRNGNPIVTSCVVKDNRDTVVARINTNKNGLAKFSFTPAWYGKYKVYVLNKDKYDSVGMLPQVNRYAAQLAVEEQNEQSIKVRVMLEDSVFTSDYTTYILGISNDSICFAGIGRGMYELNIPIANFPGGVSKLLLFNAKKELVSQRNVYINKNDVNASVTIDKQNYGARENAKLDIAVTDVAGKPLLSALSVSVIDSRIADTINNFSGDPLTELSPSDADLVMLTKKTEALVPANENEKITPSRGAGDTTLTIKGTVFNKKKERMPNYEVMLMSNKENLFVLQDTTNDNGQFSFQVPNYDNGTEFNLQVSNLKGEKEDYDIVLDPVSFPLFTTPVSLKEKTFKSNVSFIELKNKSIDSLVLNGFGKEWLPPVTVTHNEKDKKKNTLSSNVITQEMLQRNGFNNVGTAVLQTGKFHLVSGYMMEGGPNGFAPSESDEPKVFMDGQEVSVSSDNIEKSPVLTFLKTVPAEQIDYIKVLSGNEAGIYGVRGGHGVIEIHSASRATNYASTKGLKTIYPKGFYVDQPFKMPDYNNKEIRYSKAPDLRTTIYWNGDIITDKDGKASVNFFTADMPATYVVTITGITANGDKIFKTTTISRK